MYAYIVTVRVVAFFVAGALMLGILDQHRFLYFPLEKKNSKTSN